MHKVIIENLKIIKIISGGQTGADRAALDAAIECGVAHGGWCPAKRLAEDGVIDAKYQLQETISKHYPARTKANVRDADVTIVFFHDQCTQGSRKTAEYAKKFGKPCILVDLNQPHDLQASLKKIFPESTGITVNIAGPRLSSNPAIYGPVYDEIRALLFCVAR